MNIHRSWLIFRVAETRYYMIELDGYRRGRMMQVRPGTQRQEIGIPADQQRRREPATLRTRTAYLREISIYFLYIH